MTVSRRLSVNSVGEKIMSSTIPQTAPNFEIVKEWFGKNGLKSRLICCLYKGTWCYALDYNNCKESVDIPVRKTLTGLHVDVPLFVPKLYRVEVPKLINAREAKSA